MRFGVEEAGSIMGAFPRLRSLIYRYVKTEAEYRYSYKLPQTEWAFRLFGGAGFNYSNDPTIGSVMPFFKQFAGGGPNSMRAWQLRQLGLGSSIANDTITTTTFRDRLGDMMLEANLEYRFNLLTLGSFNIASVFFADIGNIWNIRKKDDNPNAEFNFRRLYKDLAVSVGTGIRFDFSYFLIRLDAGFKLKDPARPTPNGWADFKNLQFTETRPNGVQVRNFALQLGIGLPF
jgi:outer membrane protein assembly factor BamA